jgi:hypothetical protein
LTKLRAAREDITKFL